MSADNKISNECQWGDALQIQNWLAPGQSNHRTTVSDTGIVWAGYWASCCHGNGSGGRGPKENKGFLGETGCWEGMDTPGECGCPGNEQHTQREAIPAQAGDPNSLFPGGSLGRWGGGSPVPFGRFYCRFPSNGWPFDLKAI